MTSTDGVAVKYSVMKLCALFLLCFVAGCSSLGLGYNSGDSWVGPDKLYHVTVAGGIGAGSTFFAAKNGYSRGDAPIVGISMAVVVGGAKEYYDETVKYTYWSWKDFVWDIVGGVAGSYLMYKELDE